MYNKYLSTPKMMNMGFHYTEQYSRRNRINVLGLIDHSTPEWSEWYHCTHEAESLQKMADTGYNLIEIHFLYGYGLKAESEEIELTKKMVKNAHAAGIRVLGYFQFHSIQEELFYLENPWAKDCEQRQADGSRKEYCYDRPVLCFSYEKVRQYYLDGIEKGLKYCDLDGIRLDNDYFKGCYCTKCQELFRKYLTNKFSSEQARKIFGFSNLSNITMPHSQRGFDPAWLEMIKFRQQQRQEIMKLIHDKIVSIKPDGILGGNPAVTRKFDGDTNNCFYPPDLGKTHHLICVENSLFPEFTGDAIRTQSVIYKFGECSGFKVFPSHHIYTKDNKVRWPETSEECVRTLCEALCFGGHVPCTTWGIRMDENKNKTLYERPEFLKATESISRFIKQNSDIYQNTKCTATVGIYINRENRISNSRNAFASLHGVIQILLKLRIPFRFIAEDKAELLNDLELLIIPNVLPVSDKQLENFVQFSTFGKILLTGESCKHDEYFLARSISPEDIFADNPNVTILNDTPEAVDLNKAEFHGNFVKNIPMPVKHEEFASELLMLYQSQVKISGGVAIAVDVYSNEKNEHFIHLLNYDNDNPADIIVELPINSPSIELFQPEIFGGSNVEINEKSIKIDQLHTYAVIKYKEVKA